MDADERRFEHTSLTQTIIGRFYEVYNELGFGFLESVYESALEIALKDAGLLCFRQVPIPVWYRGRQIGDFRADLLVESAVIVELKAVRAIDGSHEAQLLNYLRATHIEVGLLLNFGAKPQVKRLVFANGRKAGLTAE